MQKLLAYPFDSKIILQNKKKIKKEFEASSLQFLEKKIAILGGSTTHDIKNCIELFLLKESIKPIFYESEYGQYYEDAVFGSEKLDTFSPDIIFIHTSNRNIASLPNITQDIDDINYLLDTEFAKYEHIWTALNNKFKCPIIQNNFEYPFYRILGNKDASDFHGHTNFITRFNMKLYEFAQNNSFLHINDINYLSADYGLEKWSEPFYWHMYKYALSLEAIPHLAFSVSNIIKSIFGKNKKALALDLDNTLWGGIIGDDGVENIEIGHETSTGQVYLEFQSYLKKIKQLGIILNIVSKNEHKNAIVGLEHKDSQIKPDDCILIKANWNPKSENLNEMIAELDLTQESFVFIDDNPAEREIIKRNLPNVAVPEMLAPENYIKTIDRSGFFEVTTFSKDDLSRNKMYKDNIERKIIQNSFENYADYLLSLEMRVEIKPFEDIYLSRITQLTNKTNQFNLTTKRYTGEEITEVKNNPNKIDIYGKLEDKFGDNGVVSVVIGEIKHKELHIDLWLMSCRVLKRDMELAMLDKIIHIALEKNIEYIIGYYYKTTKNEMVADFYKKLGFEELSITDNGDSIWKYTINKNYIPQNTVIAIKK